MTKKKKNKLRVINRKGKDYFWKEIPTQKIIKKLEPHEVEEHFFNKGYQYAMVHFGLACEELKIDGKLERKIRKDFMNFLEDDNLKKSQRKFKK